MAVALIVAAGRGERLGSGRPKALVTLAGRPMLEWSVAALRACDAVSRIVVALPGTAVMEAPEGVVAVAGGEVRSESVRLALAASAPPGAAPSSAPGASSGWLDDLVIVHDAARPLATPVLFTRALAALAELPDADCVITALPVTDTIKEVEPGGSRVARTLERARLWAVQTPQVFRRGALERALADASDELLAGATDDAWLVERAGGEVHVVTGDPDNFKVTVPADLARAERLLAERPAAGDTLVEPPGG